MIATIKSMATGFILFTLLVACNSSNPSGTGQFGLASGVTGHSNNAKAVFFQTVVVPTSNPDLVTSINFIVHTKPGHRSRDINVTYSIGYLRSQGYVHADQGTIEVPVFGLYQGYLNRVDLIVNRTDNTSQTTSITIQTDPLQSDFKITGIAINRPYDNPNFGFFLIESNPVSPVIVDIDGEIRWHSEIDGVSLRGVFFDKGFIAGDALGNRVFKINFKGAEEGLNFLSDPRYAVFHHNIERGKQGLLACIGFGDGSVFRPESVLIEMTPQGNILHSWDFDTIIGGAIRAAGEDPSPLVRNGVDWFHMNSAIYSPDDAILASSRENFVVKVDYQTQRIRWLLGNPGKLWYQNFPRSLQPLALRVTGDPPIGQHTLSIVGDANHLLLFNNGFGNGNLPYVGDSRSFSKASLYEINESAMTANEIWSFEDNQQLFSPICSGAYKTDSGDYLIDFSTTASRTAARIFIVDVNQNIKFDMVIPKRSGDQNSCETVYKVKEIRLDALIIN